MSFDMSIRSGNIRDQNLKLSEIAPNLTRFGPQIVFREGLPEFWDLDYKIEQTSDMWHSLTAIGSTFSI